MSPSFINFFFQSSSNERRTRKQTFKAEQQKANKGAFRGDIKIMPKPTQKKIKGLKHVTKFFSNVRIFQCWMFKIFLESSHSICDLRKV